jgi:hypothetical protein
LIASTPICAQYARPTAKHPFATRVDVDHQSHIWCYSTQAWWKAEAASLQNKADRREMFMCAGLNSQTMDAERASSSWIYRYRSARCAPA